MEFSSGSNKNTWNSKVRFQCTFTFTFTYKKIKDLVASCDEYKREGLYKKLFWIQNKDT